MVGCAHVFMEVPHMCKVFTPSLWVGLSLHMVVRCPRE